MGDIFRLVELRWPTAPLVVRDLNAPATIYLARDTLRFVPAGRRDRFSGSGARYGGAVQTGQAHDNAAIAATFYIKGNSPAAVAQRVEALLADADFAQLGRRAIEWRPDGLNESVYSRLRGNATWTPTYSWVKFAGANFMAVDISWPVAPLPELAAVTRSFATAVTPRTVTVVDVPGSAPALVDVTLTPSSPTTPVEWALLAWQQAGSGTSWFGVKDSAAWAVQNHFAEATVDNATGGSVLRMDTSAYKNAYVKFNIGQAGTPQAPFAPAGEIDVELWLWGAINPDVIGARVVASAEAAFLAVTVGATKEYARPAGDSGRPLTRSAGGRRRRLWRLGTMTLTPSDGPIIIRLDFTVAGASAGNLDVDALGIVPLRARAAAPTGKARDAAYPTVIPAATGEVNITLAKTVRSDLSGQLTATGATEGTSEHTGLGGTPITLEPGDAELAVWAHTGAVPDDPVNPGDDAGRAWLAVDLLITPRVRLMPLG